MSIGGYMVWGIVFFVILGLYLYVRSQRLSKKK